MEDLTPGTLCAAVRISTYIFLILGPATISKPLREGTICLVLHVSPGHTDKREDNKVRILTSDGRVGQLFRDELRPISAGVTCRV